jgi:hypothetical protein
MELLELGETMVTKYIEDAAPLIRPAAVESRVSGVIGGVKVSGYWRLACLLAAFGSQRDRGGSRKSPVHPVRTNTLPLIYAQLPKAHQYNRTRDAEHSKLNHRGQRLLTASVSRRFGSPVTTRTYNPLVNRRWRSCPKTTSALH